MGELAIPTQDSLMCLVSSLDHRTVASWATRGALPPIGGSLSPGRGVALDRIWLDRAGTAAGYATLYNHSALSRSAWLAVLLAPTSRRGADLFSMCGAFLTLAFHEMDIARVFCEVPESNFAALRGIERFGFERVAYLRDRDCQDGVPEDVAIFHGERNAIEHAISHRGRRGT